MRIFNQRKHPQDNHQSEFLTQITKSEHNID